MRLWKSFRVQRRNEISYYDTMGEFEAERFAVNLNQLIAEAMAEKQKAGVIFLCIGTDRSTGDSLGPLIGHKLREIVEQNITNTSPEEDAEEARIE